jgi:DNA excision repair protein ERCC-5
MGVSTLWKAIETTKENVLLNVLEGKRVAVDSSIWLYQFLKSRPEAEHAPLVGFTSRIVKLLIHDVRPIFVFDGPAPRFAR